MRVGGDGGVGGGGGVYYWYGSVDRTDKYLPTIFFSLHADDGGDARGRLFLADTRPQTLLRTLSIPVVAVGELPRARGRGSEAEEEERCGKDNGWPEQC